MRAETWSAGPGAAQAVARSGAILMEGRFGDDADRLYWDADVSLDLSGVDALALDLSCDRPASIRALLLYLRSGPGWYVWKVPIEAAPDHRVILHRSDASIEGTPAGWDRIDRIRISPWRGEPGPVRIRFRGLDPVRARVLVAESPGASRLQRWLTRAGIGYTAAPYSRLADALDAAVSVAVLPDPPPFDAAALNRIDAFLGRGVKLVVIHSDHRELAKRMGVVPQPRLDTRDIARWREIRWTVPPPAPSPASVYQTSWDVLPVQPASREARIVAVWADAFGVTSGIPAIAETPHGYWLTAHLQEDDERGKTDLVTGLLGRLDPALLEEAADHAARRAGRLGSRTSFEASVADLTAAAAASPDRETLEAFVARAKQLHQRLGDTRSATGRLAAARALDGALALGWSLAQSPRPGETVAVWEHDGTGLYPGDWDRTCRLLADHGVTTLFVNALWAGRAHYPSAFAPHSRTFAAYGDQLAQAVKAARRHGLEIHLWMVCWMLDNAPEAFVAEQKRQGRLQQTADGAVRTWLNPASKAAREYLLALIREAVTTYDLDGIHLDYIRYPDRNSDYGPLTRRAFAADTGIEPAHWPDEVLPGGVHADAFDTWRCGQIGSFVREVRTLMREAAPEMQLSAAVWGGYPEIRHSIGQDWAAWLRNDWVDFVCPMNYADTLAGFDALLARQAGLPGAPDRILPGIGVSSGESRLDPDEVIDQVLALRRRRFPGFALYDLGKTMELETLPALRRGILRK